MSTTMNRKIKNLAWIDDMVRVIAKYHKTKSAPEIADIINKKFGTNKSPDAVHSKANLHGYKLSGAA